MIIKGGDTSRVLTEQGWKEVVYVDTPVTIRGVTFITLAGVDQETGEVLIFPKDVTVDFQAALQADEVQVGWGKYRPSNHAGE